MAFYVFFYWKTVLSKKLHFYQVLRQHFVLHFSVHMENICVSLFSYLLKYYLRNTLRERVASTFYGILQALSKVNVNVIFLHTKN